MSYSFNTEIVKEYSEIHTEFQELSEELAAYTHENSYFTSKQVCSTLESSNTDEVLDFLSELGIIKTVNNENDVRTEYSGLGAHNKIRELNKYLEEK